MRYRKIASLTVILFLVPPLGAQVSPTQVIGQIVAREQVEIDMLRNYSPMVESYLQTMQDHPVLGSIPASDRYFLGRLKLEGQGEHFFLNDRKLMTRLAGSFDRFYAAEFSPVGFSGLLFVDRNGFTQQNYDFRYVRTEFAGRVRCLVYDVLPKKANAKQVFRGRIWVEDEQFNIIHFNGRYGLFHLDSWRTNLRPGQWFPTYVYAEESDGKNAVRPHLKYKAQTRIWGYNLQSSEHVGELAEIKVDPNSQMKDTTEEVDANPLDAQRAWQRSAEDNVIERLEKAGVLAPPGDVDKVLQTVISNLEITNNLQFEPEIRCRVLLTTPLEVATLGHTILVSRGLLDVLPTEASLATVLAHAIGHAAKEHELDTKYAFNDRVPSSETSIDRLEFSYSEQQETEANDLGYTLLMNSPYKDKVRESSLFLKLVAELGDSVPRLSKPNMGDALVSGHRVLLMPKVLDDAPALLHERLDQIAALPLGSRIKLDPWSSDIKLMKTNPPHILSPHDKLALQVTPFAPAPSRYGDQPGPSKAGEKAEMPRDQASQ